MLKLALVICSILQTFGSTKFIVVGDTHHYSPSPSFKESILYEITLEAIKEKVNFIFFTGDLVLNDYSEDNYTDSLLSDWKFIFDTLNVHGIKVYACRGNNDVNSVKTWASLFSDKYELPSNGPEGEKFYTYSIGYEELLFICLDLYTEYGRINHEWLDEQLQNNTKQFVFAAGHEPAFKLFHYGMAAYPDERNIFWTSFSDNKGKIYFCGHDHFYDHSVMLDGDTDPNNDVHQIIVGTGGGGFHSDSDYNGDNGFWQPTRIYHENSFGYVLVEAKSTKLRTTWRRRVGQFEFVDGGDDYSYLVTSIDSKNYAPDEFSLSQNYPNPFNPTTKIKYGIPLSPPLLKGEIPIYRDGGFVTLKVYDVLGREVATLVNEEKSPGVYEVEFTGYFYGGRKLPSGVYLYGLIFYPVESGFENYYAIKKMSLLK